MKRPARVLAGCLLALALAGCGRYGAPIRAPQTAPAAAPTPSPTAPEASEGGEADEPIAP